MITQRLGTAALLLALLFQRQGCVRTDDADVNTVGSKNTTFVKNQGGTGFFWAYAVAIWIGSM